MNATANDHTTLVEVDDGQLAPFPIKAARGTVFGLQPFALSDESPAAAPEEALAIGVFSQAAHDLRRFHAAISGVERELYLDAYSWITTNDFSWPYSFVNVCALLHASPDAMRTELLADASLGWFGHWLRLGERLSRPLRASFIRLFAMSHKGSNPKAVRSARALQRL
jgi:hypothetical protein